jgi:penicillin-binding protein-related factor A (putative recombinase)
MTITKERTVNFLLRVLVSNQSTAVEVLNSLLEDLKESRFATTILLKYLTDPNTYKFALEDILMKEIDYTKYQEWDIFHNNIIPLSSLKLKLTSNKKVKSILEKHVDSSKSDQQFINFLLTAFEKNTEAYYAPVEKELKELEIDKDKEAIKLAKEVLKETHNNRQHSINITGGEVVGYVACNTGDITQVFNNEEE